MKSERRRDQIRHGFCMMGKTQLLSECDGAPWQVLSRGWPDLNCKGGRGCGQGDWWELAAAMQVTDEGP